MKTEQENLIMKNYEQEEPEHSKLEEPTAEYSSQGFDNLPDYVKEDIRISLEQIERGEYVSFEELMKRLK